MIAKLLYCLVLFFGLFLLMLGAWGLYQYGLYKSKRRSIYFGQQGISARTYVLSFCFRNNCKIRDVPVYHTAIFFTGVGIAIWSGHFIF